MKSLSGIGLGISLVFGCLLLALVLEIYYMLFWKKRINVFQRQHEEITPDDDVYMFCCKKVSSLSSCAALNPQQICASVKTQQQLRSTGKDNVELKSEDGFLCPPRYLFTIVEETMEDLESDDDCSGSKSVKKSRKGSTSLNELMLLSVDETTTHTTTPYLTPLSSSSQSPHFGFNPFLESSSDAEISKIKASPPPKFRFLQAAEEKFHIKKMMEEEEQHSNKAPTFSKDSFITIVIGDHSSDEAH